MNACCDSVSDSGVHLAAAPRLQVTPSVRQMNRQRLQGNA